MYAVLGRLQVRSGIHVYSAVRQTSCTSPLFIHAYACPVVVDMGIQWNASRVCACVLRPQNDADYAAEGVLLELI